MIIPPYLKDGDKIGIVAPARKISREELIPALKLLEQFQFQPVLGKNLFNMEHQFAGSDYERIEDFQTFLDSPDIKAIWCARGGYGSVRIIDQLDFSFFQKHPKWICGYSDITTFHSHLNRRLGVASLHCTMPINVKEGHFNGKANQTLLKALTNKKLSYKTQNSPFNRSGEATGELVGGNLSILYSLLGSPSDIDTDGKILFIEDLDEYYYHIDRMMMNLKRNGKLEKLAALVVGDISQMRDNKIPFGKNAEAIIAEHCAEYKFPICFNFPAGHVRVNSALPLGLPYKLIVTDTYSTLKRL